MVPQVLLLPTVLLLYPPWSQCVFFFLSPTFKVTTGSWGPGISEPQQPYLISKSASPTAAGAFSSLLVLGNSFFQWTKPQHQAHWFGCNGARGLHWYRLKDCLVPGAGGGFSGGLEIDFPRAATSIANLWSVLFCSSLHLFSYFFSMSLFWNTLLFQLTGSWTWTAPLLSFEAFA